MHVKKHNQPKKHARITTQTHSNCVNIGEELEYKSNGARITVTSIAMQIEVGNRGADKMLKQVCKT